MGKADDIKIAYLFEHYPNANQPYITHLVNKLRAKEGLSLEVKSFLDAEKKTTGATVFQISWKKKFHALLRTFHKNQNKLTSPEVELLKFDIVHVQHSFLFSHISGLLMLPAAIRPKIIITLRGGDTYVKPWFSKNWAEFYKAGSTHVDAFITMSENQRNYLQRWGVPERKIHVVPVSFGDPFKAEPRYPNSKALQIVSIFRMQWEKNIDGNLRLIQELKSKGLPVKYDVFGSGRDIGQLYYLVDSYNLMDCVTVHGRTENEIIKQKLLDYDFLLQLSHSESLGMSVIEAQSYGVPCIVSNKGGLPELVENGINGIIIETSEIGKAVEQVIKIWNAKETYFEYSKNAIHNAQENFNTKVEAERLLQLYKSILK